MASATSSFMLTVKEATAWFKEQDTSSTLDKVEENQRKIAVTVCSESLYIISPETSADQWTVWSDNDATAHAVSSHLDYLGNNNRTIKEILSKLKSVLANDKVSPVNSDDDDDEDNNDDDDEEEEELDEFYDQYYGGNDEDADNEEVKSKERYSDDDDLSSHMFFTGDGSAGAVHRLLQDLKNLKKSNGAFGIDGNPRGDNLFLWDIELFDFDKTSLLHKDLINYAKTYNTKPVVQLEMKFPHDYPMNPPFARVIRPRFQFLTGHVTVGGSVCMQMLTRSGWSPSNDIEGILIQVRSEIMSDPRARLDGSPNREYSEMEAKNAFDRMVMKYGWNK